MALQQLQPLLPWLDLAVKAAAADGGSAAAKAKAKAKTGKKRRPAARAGIAARGVKALLSGVVEVVGKRFERSVPAAKFGHVAYIR